MYALKHVNPYFPLREWKRDRALGVTDNQRRDELASLASQIGDMSQKDQTFWAGHLNRIMNNDPSPEMRRLAVLAAGRIHGSESLELVQRGLGDENVKVQMEACRALGRRSEPQAARMLASTVGTTTELDVKNSAIEALGNHKGAIPMDSLRIALQDQDPATTDLAIQSLRGVTGKDFGDSPQEWIAALDQMQPPAATPDPVDGDADRIRYAQEQRTLR
ncbi:HEAT repeat domain-containing protein [Roseiconus nitratireducens]|nr:HEAT repeat domain-containing protein [Roseiconus nitratireducens]